MDNLEYIERFFNKELDPPALAEFDKKVETDPGFAEELAFYMSARETGKQLAEEEKKERFKGLYKQNPAARIVPLNKPTPVRKMVYAFAAAAAVVGIIFGVYTITQPVSAEKLAKTYIHENLNVLSVTMSARADSLQTGLKYYNEGNHLAALQQFESMIQSDTSNFTAKQYAGLSALQLKDYDKALKWFGELQTYTTNYSNPGLFYTALTLMERNQSGDAAKAKQLLQEVVQKDQDGSDIAQEWLKKM